MFCSILIQIWKFQFWVVKNCKNIELKIFLINFCGTGVWVWRREPSLPWASHGSISSPRWPSAQQFCIQSQISFNIHAIISADRVQQPEPRGSFQKHRCLTSLGGHHHLGIYELVLLYSEQGLVCFQRNMLTCDPSGADYHSMYRK